MAAVTVGAVLWWSALARSTPWFLSGGTPASHGSGITPPLVLAGALMLAGTVLAASAAARSLRATAALRA